MKKLLRPLTYLSYALFFIIILGLSIRGIQGVPSAKELNTQQWKQDGPFELSPERGRYALTYSIVENSSLIFSDEIGTFASPDVAVQNGKYVSLFAPLVSFLAIPGYILGSYFNAAQVGAFATSAFFALLNVLLIYHIARKLSADTPAAIIASMLFIFATPAYAYAVNLYQHHISTFFILTSLYSLLTYKGIRSSMVVFFLCAASIPLDYPNAFLMFPIGLFALSKIITISFNHKKLSLEMYPLRMLSPLVMIIPIAFFLWFNQASFGNPFQLSGTLQTTEDIKNTHDLPSISTQKIREEQDKEKTAIGFFETRELLNGFMIHSISKDRGVIYYTPIMIIGLIGLCLAIKKNVPLTPVISSIIGVNIVLYSMWGDPWGGWAFGSRYLIPSYALLSIYIGLLLTYWKKQIAFVVLFLPIAFYSIAVNTLGALTTSALPPQIQVLELERISGLIQKYTYEKNLDMLHAGQSKSFVYQTFLADFMTPLAFYYVITFAIMTLLTITLMWYLLVPMSIRKK